MNATKLPQAIVDRLTRNAIDEHGKQQHADRQAAIAELADLEEEWRAVIPPLDQAIRETEQTVKAAEESLGEARQELREARQERSRAAYAIDRQTDLLRSKIEGELCSHHIASALDTLSQIETATCEMPLADEPMKVQAVKARLTWIRDTARPAILKLRYETHEDLGVKIKAILDSMPPI